MAARTNKRWIAKNKAKLQKQASRLKWAKKFEYPKRKLSLQDAKDYGVIWTKTNPKWHDYSRFLKWRKICWESRLRIDPDWYRLVKLPSWWLEFTEVALSGWLKKKIVKNLRSWSNL